MKLSHLCFTFFFHQFYYLEVCNYIMHNYYTLIRRNNKEKKGLDGSQKVLQHKKIAVGAGETAPQCLYTVLTAAKKGSFEWS